MTYDVLTINTGGINFAPATEAEEILQNVRTIISTPKFSVPLDREFGIDCSVLDRPMPVAQAQLASDIITAIKDYEPRAYVSGITYEATIDGNLRPKVQVTIEDD
ncbi:MAG: hypothetical protein Q4P09_00515 [Phascolarctobacterium sp.]|nr:hypothetical protein [Phascolarctobacterium sp.]